MISTQKSVAELDCYHCGLPIPTSASWHVVIDNEKHALCCAGCEAVANTIIQSGLSSYYKQREALPLSPKNLAGAGLPKDLEALGVFDNPSVQKELVKKGPTRIRDGGDNADTVTSEVTLILEGVTCSACVWLNEQHLRRQLGVTRAEVNYSTRRVVVEWDSAHTSLSKIIVAIGEIGYKAYPYDPRVAEQYSQQERKSALWRLFVAGFGMMQVMMYAIPVYLADGDMTADIEQLMRWSSLLLTLPVICYSATPFLSRAWQGLKNRTMGMDVPVALGIGVAFAASTWATLTGTGDVYFDSVTMFVFLLLGGRYLEMIARQKSIRNIEDINSAMPTLAYRVTEFPSLDGKWIPACELKHGDRVLIKPGEIVPADGIVLSGHSGVDESLLTGESRPVNKVTSAEVTCGSANIDSPLIVEVTAVNEETRLAAIQKLMSHAAAERPKIVVMADRIAANFVAVLLVLAVITAGIWMWHAPDQALWVFVSVLVVSCPCALSLATPAVQTVAMGTMAKIGLLVTKSHAIEKLAGVTHFVFDKTGTLTIGKPVLIDVRTISADVAKVLAIAGALEQTSSHPIATAIIEAANIDQSLLAENVQMTVGQGIQGVVAGEKYYLGSLGYVSSQIAVTETENKSIDTWADDIRSWRECGHTVVALASPTTLVAVFRIGDAVRDGVQSVINELINRGIKVSIMSGDDQVTVSALAEKLGVKHAAGNLRPEDKYAAVKKLQAEGAIVGMMGDGVNDAPVLAQAHVAIAMGGGADLARTHADIVLLGNSLQSLLQGMLLARMSMKIQRQNLVWAFAYNILAIPLAMAGWITPWMAGVGMSASSLLVVMNALRLQQPEMQMTKCDKTQTQMNTQLKEAI